MDLAIRAAVASRLLPLCLRSSAMTSLRSYPIDTNSVISISEKPEFSPDGPEPSCHKMLLLLNKKEINNYHHPKIPQSYPLI